MPEISEAPKGSFTKFFGTVRQKIFDGNLWYPLLCIKFFDTPNFLKHWRDAHEIFRHYETNKNFWRKNVIPFSSIKHFEAKNFLKNSRIPLRKFSALWDIKNSTENRDMPPLIHNFFLIPKNFRKTEGCLYKAFRLGHVRQKVPTKPWSPPLLCMKIFDKGIFLKHQSVLQGNISAQRDKTFSTENLDTPPPSYPNFLNTRNYCNSKGFPYGNFRHCETKNFRRKILIPPPPSYQNFFDTRNYRNTKGFPPTEIFGTVRQKHFDRKSWYPLPPLWCIKFFTTRKFLIHRSVPNEIFRYCEAKNFERKVVHRI